MEWLPSLTPSHHRLNPPFATCIWKWTRWLDQSIDWFKTSMFRLLDCPSDGVWVDKNKPQSESLRHQVGGIIRLACPRDPVDLSFHFCSRSVMEEVYCSLQLQPCNSWANRWKNKWGQSLRWMFCHYFTLPVSFPAACTPVSGIKVAFQLPKEHMFYELFQQINVLNRGDVLVTPSGLGHLSAVSVFLWVWWSQPAVLLQRRSKQALLFYLFCFYFCTALRGSLPDPLPWPFVQTPIRSSDQPDKENRSKFGLFDITQTHNIWSICSDYILIWIWHHVVPQ